MTHGHEPIPVLRRDPGYEVNVTVRRGRAVTNRGALYAPAIADALPSLVPRRETAHLSTPTSGRIDPVRTTENRR